VGGTCIVYGGRVEVYTEFWWRTLRGRDHLEDPGIEERIILGWIFREWNVRSWTGSVGLGIWIVGRHL
jgi:hypothetical protein